MSLMKNFTVRGTRGVSLRVQANNVLNDADLGIDRHRRQLADVRAGHVGALDAVGADRPRG